jgi:hypothetical protein
MKNYKSKLSVGQIAHMRVLRNEGNSYAVIGKKFGVCTGTVIYNLDERSKMLTKARGKRYAQTHSEEMRKKSKSYMHTPKGMNIVARSWIRHYLREKVLTKEDVLDVLSEFNEVVVCES